MSVNFYRETYLDGYHERIVNLCRIGDKWSFLREFMGTGTLSQMTYEHEDPAVRPGMRLIRELINSTYPKGSHNILDVGCALGNLMKLLMEDGHTCTGVDCCPTMIVNSKLPVVFAFAESLPFPDNCFDVVIMQEVLEHVMNLDQALDEVKRVLKPGGRYFFQVPWQNHADCVEHVRHFTEEKMVEILREKDLELTEIKIIKYLDIMEFDNIFVHGRKK